MTRPKILDWAEEMENEEGQDVHQRQEQQTQPNVQLPKEQSSYIPQQQSPGPTDPPSDDPCHDAPCSSADPPRDPQITSRFDGVIKKLHYEADDMARVGKVSALQK